MPAQAALARRKSMPANAALAKSYAIGVSRQPGLYLTFVVGDHCDLDCSFCIIQQTGEVSSANHMLLQPGEYVQFLRSIHSRYHVLGVKVQGYEALLPGVAWESTKAILETAQELSIHDRGLVTNGTHLVDHADELARLEAMVVVSIDSHIPRAHDRLRRNDGAFVQTVSGVQALVRAYRAKHGAHGTNDRITITSILMSPKHTRNLSGMPSLVKRLGLDDWVVEPLLKSETDSAHVMHENHDIVMAVRDKLVPYAEKAGITLSISDDSDAFLQEREQFEDMMFRYLENPHSHVVRLSSYGHVRHGKGTLQKVTDTTPVWNRTEDPVLFFRRVLPSLPKKMHL